MGIDKNPTDSCQQQGVFTTVETNSNVNVIQLLLKFI
jgi:hypothetical protein